MWVPEHTRWYIWINVLTEGSYICIYMLLHIDYYVLTCIYVYVYMYVRA